MTIIDIQFAIKPLKDCSTKQLRRYIKDLDIKPVGHRTRPIHYPMDTAAKILVHLGLDRIDPKANARIVTMNQLRAERAKAQNGRRRAA
jgi:hypothetical protein